MKPRTACERQNRFANRRAAIERGSRKVIKEGKAPKAELRGSVPRISRLMALAIHMQKLMDESEVTDYAELARLAHVSRARITHIMNLLHLARQESRAPGLAC